jgi:transposase
MAKHIYLPQDERTELEQLIKSGEQRARAISRARVLLLLDRGQGHSRKIAEVAEAVMLTSTTVSKIKGRYFAEGLAAALYDKPRPGRPVTKMTGEVEAHLIALTCNEPPEGHDRWTLRLLADQLVTLELVDSISHVAVSKTLKKTNSSLGK